MYAIIFLLGASVKVSWCIPSPTSTIVPSHLLNSSIHRLKFPIWSQESPDLRWPRCIVASIPPWLRGGRGVDKISTDLSFNFQYFIHPPNIAFLSTVTEVVRSSCFLNLQVYTIDVHVCTSASSDIGMKWPCDHVFCCVPHIGTHLFLKSDVICGENIIRRYVRKPVCAISANARDRTL